MTATTTGMPAADEMWRAYSSVRLRDDRSRETARRFFTDEYVVDQFYALATEDGRPFVVFCVAWNDPVVTRHRVRESWLLAGGTKEWLDRLSAVCPVLVVLYSTPEWAERFAWRYDRRYLDVAVMRDGSARFNIRPTHMASPDARVLHGWPAEEPSLTTLGPAPWERRTTC